MKLTSNDWFKRCIALAACAFALTTTAHAAAHPNVVIIIADDMGYGDLGAHGNTIIKTPNLDRLATESATVRSFYVSPVCAPTRASLLTGRYNYRTRAIDTFRGRAMMDADETTLAEILRAAGWHTGIFGKWHLGDNYPMRPMDQGFEESLVHRGGGLAQASDPPGERTYFDPTLWRNGVAERAHGYCSDIYTREAIDFVTRHKAEPFFLYLPFNAPHTPLQVDESLAARHRGADFATLGNGPSKIDGELDTESITKLYGMIENIDENVGRVLEKLDELKLAENTIVIFLTDNGPQFARYNAGLHGLKGTVYDGGIRVPFYMRWPGRLAPGRAVEQACAHIDITPTLLEACGVAAPAGIPLDGRSFLPLIEGRNADWPDRNLFFQWHRGDRPEPHRAFAVRGARWKLLQAKGTAEKPFTPEPTDFELYDIAADPNETTNLAATNPEIVKSMLADYDRWFEDVSRTRGYEVPRMLLRRGDTTPMDLTAQDWRGETNTADWNGLGGWQLGITSWEGVAADGAGADEVRYELLFDPMPKERLLYVATRTGEPGFPWKIPSGATSLKFRAWTAPGTLRAAFKTPEGYEAVKYATAQWGRLALK